MRNLIRVLLIPALLATHAAHAQSGAATPYTARAFNPAHGDLARSAGVPAQLANEEYVEALARLVYYWGYPAVDGFGRTNMWQIMKNGSGSMLGILPGAPMNTTGCLVDYMSPAQRWVVTPNNDTLYGAGFANLAVEPAVIQTPTDVPKGHYWTIQVTDVFTNVIHQLGSASATPGGKFLLVGPDWTGQKPDGFIDVLRVPTNVAGVFPRSFAARTPEAKARAVGSNDAAMADQARTLIALRKSNADYRALLDRAALAADAALHASSTYVQVGVDAGNGWQKQEGAGRWGSDWFSRAQAAVIYIYVNDYREATYFIRGTDANGVLLDGRYIYTMTFAKDGLPPMDQARGGFWSLTMYDKDDFMLPDSPNGRTNIGTVNLDANELKFAADGSLTITIAHQQPATAEAQANWLPAPEDQFALIVRAYVPTQPVLDGSYKLPNVERAAAATVGRGR